MRTARSWALLGALRSCAAGAVATGIGAALVGILSATAVGCAPASESRAPESDVAPDAVAVDFYTTKGFTAACAGSLLSANVVVTSAHCATSATAARVKAPNASGQQAEVDRVLFFDWGTTPDHAGERDIALLLLRSPIAADAYARVDDSTALRAAVSVGGRYVDASSRAALDVSEQTTVSDAAPAGRPHALALKTAADGATAGGAVRRPDGSLIGVYMGQGGTTGSGYFTRIDDAATLRWMQGVVAAKGGVLALAPNAGGTLTATPMPGAPLTRNSGGGSGGSGGGGTGGDSGGDGGTGEPVGDGPTGDGSGKGDPTPAPIKYDDGTIAANSPTAQVSKGDNYWAAFEPKDPVNNGADAAYAAKHPDVAEVGAHGEPGFMANRPDAAALQSVADGKDGMLVASCFAGANQANGGVSNAASLADEAGLDRSQVYGCTTTMNLTESAANCDGSWVDGNGAPVPASTATKYNLQTQDPCHPGQYRGVSVNRPGC